MISVIVPIYNSEKYLQECLNSLSCQTVSNFEIILVDDGSTDDSGRLCDEFALTNKNSKVIHQKNSGLLLARREGMKAASGDYFMSLDSDDCLRNDAIKKIQLCIEQYSPDIICFDFSRARNRSFSGVRVGSGLPRPGYFRSASYKEVKKAVCSGDFNSMANKAFARKVVGVDSDYSIFAGLMHGEDWLQLLDIVDKAEDVFYINEKLYFYRESQSSSTYAFKPTQLKDIDLVFEHLLEYAEKWGPDYLASANCAIGKHATWLIYGISKMKNNIGMKEKEELVQKVVSLLEKRYKNNTLEIVKRLRFDFKIPLEFALSGKNRAALHMVRILQSGYRLISSLLYK